MKYLLLLAFAVLLLVNCQNEPDNKLIYGNPPAEGFNLDGSDSLAISLADSIMEKMGGRQNWDETNYLIWNFFGARKHYWNKKTGDIRIESVRDSTIYLMNIHNMEGKVKIGESLQTEPDSLKNLLINGKSMWINDSYWLVMPYKLKDSGVTLTYAGADTTQAGKPADMLQLTFNGVGETPDNKYIVYVDKDRQLITQWAFYSDFSDVEPRFVTPWDDYQQYGNILLAGNRGRGALTEIAAPDSLDNRIFQEF